MSMAASVPTFLPPCPCHTHLTPVVPTAHTLFSASDPLCGSRSEVFNFHWQCVSGIFNIIENNFQKIIPQQWQYSRVLVKNKLEITKKGCLVAQSCPTLCNTMGCSLPSSSVHEEILQARTQEWADMPSSRGSSQPRDWTQVSSIAGGFFTVWATRKTQEGVGNGNMSRKFMLLSLFCSWPDN